MRCRNVDRLFFETEQFGNFPSVTSLAELLRERRLYVVVNGPLLIINNVRSNLPNLSFPGQSVSTYYMLCELAGSRAFFFSSFFCK